MSSDSQVSRIQSLIDRLKAGDSGALNELLILTLERLGHQARRMLRGFPAVGRWEQTDDIIQGASMRLCRALSEVPLETSGDYFGLATTQIRRELLDLKRRYSGPHGLGTNFDSHDSDRGPGPVDAACDDSHDPQRLAGWTEFHEAAGELAEDQRSVFDLIYYQGLTRSEAAGVLGISEKSVTRRYQAARLALHASLGGHFPGM